MLICGIDLALTNRPQRGVCRCTDGTLGVLVDAVEAALVERVTAEEVDRGKIEGSTAGLAATGLEDDGLGSQVVEFLFFGGCFGLVAGDQALILLKKLISGKVLEMDFWGRGRLE